jgi:hypothetical protein
MLTVLMNPQQGVIQHFEFGGVLKYEWGSGSAEPPPPAEGVRGITPQKNLGILHAKS